MTPTLLDICSTLSTGRCSSGQEATYDPDAFDPKAVVFDNPRKRWKKAFES